MCIFIENLKNLIQSSRTVQFLQRLHMNCLVQK